MSSRIVNVLAALVAGACVAALVTLAAPTTVEGRAYPVPSQVQEDEPGWDCATMGNHACGNVRAANYACWVEKVDSAATAEVICGDRGDRPSMDTADIGQVFGESCGWVALPPAPPTYPTFDIEPAGCN